MFINSKIPSQVANDALNSWIKRWYNLKHQGKVWDTYDLGKGFLLRVASNRISIFEFVLPCLVPSKGEALNQLTIFWSKYLNELKIKNHIVAYGIDMHDYLAFSMVDKILYGKGSHVDPAKELYRRAVVVKKGDMLDGEFVYRGYLTGSGYESYILDGTVNGQKLPGGLFDGNRLSMPLFTPTTKEEIKHDQPMSVADATHKYGSSIIQKGFTIYRHMKSYMEERKLILADTKFEFTSNGVLADEFGTMDSSRIWLQSYWEAAQLSHKAPAGYDKQPVRNYGKSVQTPWGVGINNLDPENPDHRQFVDNMKIPDTIIRDTTERYVKTYQYITGSILD